MLSTVLTGLLLDSAFSSSSSLAIASIQTGDNGPSDGDDGGAMSEWSSTIGIVTAIAGNILISFALNIQRYAHIRIDREYERNRQRLRWSRRTSGSDQIPSHGYGTVGEGGEHVEEPEQGVRTLSATNERGDGVEGDGRGSSRPYRDDAGSHGEPTNGDGSSHIEQPDPMNRSFQSDRTLVTTEKSYYPGERKSYLRSPYWWAGIVLMTVGEAGNFLAYGFAPASIVSPLGVVALISNCIIAPFMLKETFRQRDFWGVLIAIAGAVTIVLSAKNSETKIGPGEIWGMITQWEFELYLGLTVALILVLMWCSNKYGNRTILIDLGLVGLFGGYTALSTKGVASLLSFTLWHVITFPITYGLVAVLVISALMQIRYLNRALQRFDSTQVIPTQFVLFTISVIVGSAVLYRDFESTTLAQAIKFVGGCALTFLGVYFITSGRERGDDESSQGDEEEAIGLLNGQRYQDRVDDEDEARTARAHTVGPNDAAMAVSHSPAHSLLSEDVDEGDEGIQTPKAQLSSSPSSPTRSISETPFTRSLDASPEPLSANPWATPHDGPSEIPETGSAPSSLEPPYSPTNSKVQLRFPSAPGPTESPAGDTAQIPSEIPRPSTPIRVDTQNSRSRRSTVTRTPGSTSRNSISRRFAPGPFLPPLSGGLSAVVAESLRRGEGSTRRLRERHGTVPRRKGKRQAKARPLAGPGEEHAETDYETDGSYTNPEGDTLHHEHAHNSRSWKTPRHGQGFFDADETERRNTQNAVPTISSSQPPGDGVNNSSNSPRVRSLSDSYSEGLGWMRQNSERRQRENGGGSMSPFPSLQSDEGRDNAPAG